MRKRAIAVLGGRAGNAGTDAVDLAVAVGAEIGRRRYGLVSGGDGGIAQAANQACTAAGGETLALLKWNRLDDCGPDVGWSLPTSMDLARSNILNWAGDGVIAFEGRYGTLSEIALALDTGRPLVVLGEQPFLDPRALQSPTCRHLPDPRPDDAAAILDALEELMAACAPPPARPTAALLTEDLTADRGVGLRVAVPGDLEMVRRAFDDPEVRRWWDHSAEPAELARFQHERNLTITEDARPVGFVEYEVGGGDDVGGGGDADQIRLTVVVAAAADRNRGIGTRALTRFAAAAFDAGTRRIAVVCDAANDSAVRCYERSGFRRVGVLRSYLEHRGTRRDALMLDLLPDDLRTNTGEETAR